MSWNFHYMCFMLTSVFPWLMFASEFSIHPASFLGTILFPSVLPLNFPTNSTSFNILCLQRIFHSLKAFPGLVVFHGNFHKLRPVAEVFHWSLSSVIYWAPCLTRVAFIFSFKLPENLVSMRYIDQEGTILPKIAKFSKNTKIFIEFIKNPPNV